MPLFLSHPVSTNLNKKMVQQIERSSKGDFFIKNRRLSISHVVCAVEMKLGDKKCGTFIAKVVRRVYQIWSTSAMITVVNDNVKDKRFACEIQWKILKINTCPHMYSKEFFSIHSHKNLESHRLVGRQEVFQFLYYFYHVWLPCYIIRCGSLKCHKFVTYAQGKKKTKNIEKFCWAISNLATRRPNPLTSTR